MAPSLVPRKSAAALQHPIRIVPLHRPERNGLPRQQRPSSRTAVGRCSLPSKSSPFLGYGMENKQSKAQLPRT